MDASQQHIAIIGAGIGGICMGIALRRQLPGFDNFVIYEQASDVGGTWRNSDTYPGSASDIGINFYSHSAELKYDWTHTHASQPEILAYWRHLIIKYDLDRHIRLNTRVTKAVWDEQKAMYSITTASMERNGKEEATWAKVVVSALGVTGVPKIPDIPGLENFKGPSFHSAEWEQGLELHGKKIAIVGSGPSATQLLTTISEDPTVQIIQFYRTPNWYFPNSIEIFGPFKRFFYQHVPLSARLARFALWAKWEFLIFWPIFGTRLLHSILDKWATNYILHIAPKKYHERLIPNYTIGAKRPIHDTGYLSALHRSNVDLNWDGIRTITEDGVITRNGEHLPLDVIVFATGYIADEFFIDVRGTSTTVKEYYEQHGGPYAYRSVAMPGFPNFYMLTGERRLSWRKGPNSVNGSTPLTFSLEVHANYVLKLLRPIINGDMTFIAPTQAATDMYNVGIQRRLKKMVWMDAHSWYRTGGGKGRLTSATPYPGSWIWWSMSSVIWGDFEWGEAEGKSWAKKVRMQRQAWVILSVLLVGILSFSLQTALSDSVS